MTDTRNDPLDSPAKVSAEALGARVGMSGPEFFDHIKEKVKTPSNDPLDAMARAMEANLDIKVSRSALTLVMSAGCTDDYECLGNDEHFAVESHEDTVHRAALDALAATAGAGMPERPSDPQMVTEAWMLDSTVLAPNPQFKRDDDTMTDWVVAEWYDDAVQNFDAMKAYALELRTYATALTAASVAKDAEIVRLRAQNNELAQMVADLANRKPLATGGPDV